MEDMYEKKTRNVFEPNSKTPFGISRSKIDLYHECPRCFYMDTRLGLSRPSIPAYSLNNAVDNLLKNEFDLLRDKKESHDLMKKYKIDAIPLSHPDLPKWRDDMRTYEGAGVVHKPTNLRVYGLIDDIWVNPEGEFIIVDYKATSTTSEISLDDKYKQGYKRQMEIYQWIFRQLGFIVNKTGYFVFANAMKNMPKFDGKLVFDMTIIPYLGNPDWVEPMLFDMRETLNSQTIPNPSPECEYCEYKKLSAQTVAKWK